METNPNNNVREIAEMQMKIDSYEFFISTLYCMAKKGEVLNYLTFNNIPYKKEMNFLWNFVKNKKDVE